MDLISSPSCFTLSSFPALSFEFLLFSLSDCQNLRSLFVDGLKGKRIAEWNRKVAVTGFQEVHESDVGNSSVYVLNH